MQEGSLLSLILFLFFMLFLFCFQEIKEARAFFPKKKKTKEPEDDGLLEFIPKGPKINCLYLTMNPCPLEPSIKPNDGS